MGRDPEPLVVKFSKTHNPPSYASTALDHDSDYYQLYRVFGHTTFCRDGVLIIPVAVLEIELGVGRIVDLLRTDPMIRLYVPWIPTPLTIQRYQVYTYPYTKEQVLLAQEIVRNRMRMLRPDVHIPTQMYTPTKQKDDKLNCELFKIKILTLKQDE